jgi:hypothetical protein
VFGRVLVVVSKFLGAAIVSCAVLVSFSAVYAQEARKSCPGVEIISLHKAMETPDPNAKESAEILVSSAPAPALTVIALGPVLGSMDSTDVKTELTCTPQGLRVTATLARSSNYNGAALKNVLWRPKLTLEMTLRKDKILFESVWVMRLSTGAKLDHAQTPSQPDQKYPITVTRELSLHAP